MCYCSFYLISIWNFANNKETIKEITHCYTVYIFSDSKVLDLLISNKIYSSLKIRSNALENHTKTASLRDSLRHILVIKYSIKNYTQQMWLGSNYIILSRYILPSYVTAKFAKSFGHKYPQYLNLVRLYSASCLQTVLTMSFRFKVNPIMSSEGLTFK